MCDRAARRVKVTTLNAAWEVEIQRGTIRCWRRIQTTVNRVRKTGGIDVDGVIAFRTRLRRAGVERRVYDRR